MVVCLRPTGVKLDENWGDAKKMLADTSLLDKLKRYPKDSITEKMMKSVRKYFKNPKMTVENMKSVSKAGMRFRVLILGPFGPRPPRRRDAVARGVTMASPRTHLCWKRRRRDATHKSGPRRATATLRATSIVTRWRPWRRAHASPARTPYRRVVAQARASSSGSRPSPSILMWPRTSNR